MAAYYDNNIDELKKLLNKINKLHDATDLKLRTNLALIYLEKKENQLDPKFKKQIINEFIKNNGNFEIVKESIFNIKPDKEKDGFFICKIQKI